MGCDYFVDEDADEVRIEVIDYSTGEFIDHLIVDSDRFKEGKMDVRIKGAERRG